MYRSALILALMTLMGLLGACSEGKREGIFKSIGSRPEAPVEFAVIPHHPLELPEDLQELPVPNPGGRSRTDLTPIEDALVALGGSPSGGISVQSDAAILAATGATRAPADIRRTLAVEDAEYRNGNKGKFFERVFNKVSESTTYEDMILDAELEAQRLRVRGLQTPDFPPIGTE